MPGLHGLEMAHGPKVAQLWYNHTGIMIYLSPFSTGGGVSNRSSSFAEGVPSVEPEGKGHSSCPAREGREAG